MVWIRSGRDRRGIDTFPMLDDGYLYLAATRLCLHRSDTDWALVIEWETACVGGRRTL